VILTRHKRVKTNLGEDFRVRTVAGCASTPTLPSPVAAPTWPGRTPLGLPRESTRP